MINLTIRSIMDPERLSIFLDSLETEEYPLLDEIAAFGRGAGIPIARRETASFLRTIARITEPSRVLEVGTAIGYSAIVLSEAYPDSRITSIEIKRENYDMACGFVRRAETEGLVRPDHIELLLGDAGEIFPELDGCYDLIFMDAAKAQYIVWLPEMIRLLSPGGVLISDNVLQDGTLIESRFAVERRDRTIHRRMRDYLYAIKHDARLTSSVLPLGDGVALSVKRRD